MASKKVYIKEFTGDDGYARFEFVPEDAHCNVFNHEYDNKQWKTRKGAENWAAKHGYQIIGEW